MRSGLWSTAQPDDPAIIGVGQQIDRSVPCHTDIPNATEFSGKHLLLGDDLPVRAALQPRQKLKLQGACEEIALPLREHRPVINGKA